MSEKKEDVDFLKEMEGVEKMDPTSKIEGIYTSDQSFRFEEVRENAQYLPEEDSKIYPYDVDEYVEPDAVIEWKLDGVQPGDFKNLKEGIYAPQSEIDLHHRSVAETRTILWEYLADAHANSERTVLVVHGRGMRGRVKGRLKSFVRVCLIADPKVLAFCSAPRHMGGTGAVLVQLRKIRTVWEG